MDLWEWEVCGKFKAAKLRKGTIDKGERQNLKVNTVNKQTTNKQRQQSGMSGQSQSLWDKAEN